MHELAAKITKDCVVYINVDPHPNKDNIENLKLIGEKYFKSVVFNVPNTCNCGKAFKWGLNNFKSDYLFFLEANKCIVKKFNINELINKFNISDRIVGVCLSPPSKNKNHELLYVPFHPALWKRKWLKSISNFTKSFSISNLNGLSPETNV